MKAILMAAGCGRRISHEIEIPKSLLKIGDTTIIGHSIKMLLQRNIEVAVVVGYKKEQIIRTLIEMPVAYYYNPFFRRTNSIASLWMARDYLMGNEDIILANADVYWEDDILDILLSGEENACVLGDGNRCKEGDYFYTIDEKKCIKKYGKDIPENERSCEYVGAAIIKKEFVTQFIHNLEELINREEYDLWWEDVLYRFSSSYPVRVLDIGSCFWGEVDKIDDYQRIKEYINSRK